MRISVIYLILKIISTFSIKFSYYPRKYVANLIAVLFHYFLKTVDVKIKLINCLRVALKVLWLNSMHPTQRLFEQIRSHHFKMTLTSVKSFNKHSNHMRTTCVVHVVSLLDFRQILLSFKDAKLHHCKLK